MIYLAPLLESAAFVATSFAADRASSRIAARRIATLGASLSLVLAVGLWAFAQTSAGAATTTLFGLPARVLPHGLFSLAPLTTCAVGVVAVAMAPLSTHSTRTLARVLRVIAVALGFLATRHAVVLAVLWTLSVWITWYELRERDSALGRLFAIYQVPSAVLFAAGAILIGSSQSSLGVLLLICGIIIREAVVPVHSWFPRFVERAPMGLVVAFSAPQLGVYAQLELLSAGIPVEMAHRVALFGGVTAVLAAALALVQRDARRALAYLIISQTGLVAFGLENDSPVALSGALLTWQVLALATCGFAMSIAAVFARRGVLWLDQPGGSFARTPRLATAFLILGLSTVGFPLTLGFVAEDLLVQGAVESYPWLAFVLIVATAFNGITVMRCFFNLFSGSREDHGERDLTNRESYALTLVIAMLVLGGLMPKPIVALHVPHHHHEHSRAPEPTDHRSLATATRLDALSP